MKEQLNNSSEAAKILTDNQLEQVLVEYIKSDPVSYRSFMSISRDYIFQNKAGIINSDSFDSIPLQNFKAIASTEYIVKLREYLTIIGIKRDTDTYIRLSFGIKLAITISYFIYYEEFDLDELNNKKQGEEDAENDRKYKEEFKKLIEKSEKEKNERVNKYAMGRKKLV